MSKINYGNRRSHTTQSLGVLLYVSSAFHHHTWYVSRSDDGTKSETYKHIVINKHTIIWNMSTRSCCQWTICCQKLLTLWQWNTTKIISKHCYFKHKCKKTYSFDLRDTLTWWRHQMETFSALLAIYAGNSPVTGEFPSQRPVTRSFDVFFDLRLNKPLSKQWWGWWFETLSRPLWRHYNELWELCTRLGEHIFWCACRITAIMSATICFLSISRFLFTLLSYKWFQMSTFEHIEAETKWQPFRRRNFQMHFLESNRMVFD